MFAILAVRSRYGAARLLSCSSCSALQQIQVQQQQQQQIQQQGQAFHSSSSSSIDSSSSEDDHKFVGAYTPVTKQLWLDRLRKAEQQQHQAAGAAAGVLAGTEVQPAAAKAPQVTRVDYPFTKDKFLLEMYRNPWGFLRMGRLLEDLDSLAGSIAFAHCQVPGLPPPLLVTAAVDAIEYQRPAVLSADMACQGQVVYTGGSSLDIRMELLQEPHAPSPSLVALFSFVLLDPATKRPAKVPQLQPVTPQEQRWAAERAAVAAARKAARKAAQGKPQLSAEQQQLLQEALSASRLLLDMPALADPSALTAEETSLSNAFVCQPQQRNMHGRIFGGFLMRRAFELAFASTYLFAGSRPAFVRVEDITFRNPVDVGSLLRFKSHVVHVSYHPAAAAAAPAEGTAAGTASAESAQPAAAAAATEEQQQQPQQQRVAHVAVEVEAVVSQPEQKETTHTNTFRWDG